MKKQRKAPQRKKRAQSTDVATPDAKMTRRDLLRWGRYGAVALPFVGGAGYLGAQSFLDSMCEIDLTKVGQGIPAVVQVHDPQCPMCQTLQRQARRALRSFEDDELRYLVANITSPDGLEFASRYGVPHVTLLLFDPEGELIEVLRGPNNADTLRTAFGNHLSKYS